MIDHLSLLNLGGGAPIQYEKKESRTTTALLTVGLGQVVWPERDYETFARRAYMLNADVYQCVSLIAGSAKQVPWFVTAREDGKPVGPSHPLDRIRRAPSERQSWAEFIDACCSYLLITGNSYVEGRGPTENGPPIWLYPLRPDRIRIVKGSPAFPIKGYEYKVNADPVVIPADNMLHMKLFHPLDDWYGLSPLEAALYTVANSNEAQSLYKKLLQRGYPPGAVKVNGEDWGDDQIAAFKRGLKRATEASEVLYLGNAEWQEMGFKPIDASLFEGRSFNKRDIAAIYRIPPEMIGDAATKTFSNYKEARRALYTEAVLPILVHLRDGFNRWLSPVFDGAVLQFDKDSIDALSEDRDVTATRVHKLWTSSLIKRNEARAEMQYEEVEEAEDGYFSDLVKPALAPQRDSPLLAGTTDDEKPANDRVIPIRQTRLLESGTYLKSFNLLSEEARDTYAKSVDEHRDHWVDRVSADAEDRFHDERNSVLKAYREGGEPSALRAVTRQEDSWTLFYRHTYFNVAEDFGRRTLQGFKAHGYDLETKFELDVFTRTVQEWLAVEGAKRVVGVLDVTKEKIRTELLTGLAARETTFELSKRLQSMYENFGNIRSERIARTEVIGASNLGSQTAARSTNLPLEKQWLSTPDDRTRDHHVNAHNQRQRIDVPYNVGGYSLMYPGDSSLGAPGSEIIQCRCSESYAVRRG